MGRCFDYRFEVWVVILPPGPNNNIYFLIIVREVKKYITGWLIKYRPSYNLNFISYFLRYLILNNYLLIKNQVIMHLMMFKLNNRNITKWVIIKVLLRIITHLMYMWKKFINDTINNSISITFFLNK
jgi:hypothetical protein